nr:MAG TPA: hypothetical protein [Caudoviricetes sp.]
MTENFYTFCSIEFASLNPLYSSCCMSPYRSDYLF